ncbi:hypothetical protein [Streptomyces sp. MK37H]|uniref:hypothetical protein n=1 Tax=Streptomyces sp. MK37H TaxID=2699117 RepID=UPI001FF81D40|nr:hypothetical protein [Streptomyces sp. MK37H]
MTVPPNASTPENEIQPRHFLERLGIPKVLVWGFVGVLLFMIGDGVESGYLSPYLIDEGVAKDQVALLFTVYGVTASIAAWFSGALSDLWVTAVTPEHRLGSAVGWFWFAFTGGLPTLGSLFASLTIPWIGAYSTLWSSLALVVAGGLIALPRATTIRSPCSWSASSAPRSPAMCRCPP